MGGCQSTLHLAAPTACLELPLANHSLPGTAAGQSQLAWNCRWPITACLDPVDCAGFVLVPAAVPGGFVGS